MNKYGKIFDYSNRAEAKEFIGKRGVFSDLLQLITEKPDECVTDDILVFVNEGKAGYRNFYKAKDSCRFQFFRPILEEEKPQLMSHRQLAEWLAKGYGELRLGKLVSDSSSYYLDEEDDPVKEEKDYLIRRWGSDEWILPTVDVYREDCQ